MPVPERHTLIFSVILLFLILGLRLVHDVRHHLVDEILLFLLVGRAVDGRRAEG